MNEKRCMTRREMLAAASLAAAGCAIAPGIAGAEESVAETLASSEVVDFLYIDNAEMGVGETQSIAVALRGYTDFSDATLTLVNYESGDSAACPLDTSSDCALLFTFCPETEGTYEVNQLAFCAGGAHYIVDFDDCDVSYRSFTTEATASALSFGSGEDKEPELKTYAGDGSGDVAEYGTIEDAASDAVESTPGAVTPEDVAASDASAANAAAVTAATVASVRTAAVRTAATTTSPLVVAIDPGHYGADSGAAPAGRTNEATCNWKIANACVAALGIYSNIRAVLTVSEGQRIPADPGSGAELQWRVDQAVKAGANALVSIHINAGGGNGAEVYVPYNGSYNNETHAVGSALGQRIVSELEKLGLYNRGVKIKTTSGSSYEYADGSDGDYYGIIRRARQKGLPAIIVEHAFIDSSDYTRFLNSDEKLQSLGQADARGIVNYYGLTINSKPGAVYRLYNSRSGEHLFTMDSNEYATLPGLGIGWKQEGTAWISATKDESSLPVYRLYNTVSGDHHYTCDLNEYRTLPRYNWRQEGVAWYSDPSQTVPVYRLFNPKAFVGTHLFTRDRNEYNTLPRYDWRQEGVAWYAKAVS